MAAIGAHQRREIGVEEVGARYPAGVVLLLVHADRAVATVVGDDHDHRGALLRGGAQLVHGHLQAAVAGHADHGAAGVGDLRRDGGGQAVAHRARGRRDLRPRPLEAEIAMQERRIVTRAVGDDGVLGQVGRKPADHLLHPHRAGGGLRGLPRLVMRAQAGGPVVPAARRGRLGQRGECRLGAGGDAGIGAPQVADLVGVGIDVDDPPPLLTRVHQLIAGGQRIAQPRAERQDAVGLAQRLAQPQVHPHAQVARIVRVPVVHVVLPAEGHRNRQPPPLGQPGQRVRVVLRPERAARHDQRPLGGGERVADRRHLRLGHARHGAGGGREVGDVGLGRQHVLGQRQHHRAGAPGAGEVEGAGDVFGDALGLVDLGHPLGQPAEHLAVVDLLERLAVAVGPGDLADEQDHRGRVLLGDVDAGAGVGGAGAAGDEADAGPAGGLGPGLGHHRGPTLLPADGVGDAHVVEPVERREEAFAGDREHPLDPVQRQRVRQNPSAMPHRPIPLALTAGADCGNGRGASTRQRRARRPSCRASCRVWWRIWATRTSRTVSTRIAVMRPKFSSPLAAVSPPMIRHSCGSSRSP